MGAQFVCCTDYPSKSVLQNLDDNITYNFKNTEYIERIGCQGYIWGESVDPLLEANGGSRYDIILASECLWRHEQVRLSEYNY